jgi:hypothetical protein
MVTQQWGRATIILARAHILSIRSYGDGDEDDVDHEDPPGVAETEFVQLQLNIN